ncbi:hypothetical protein BOX15_Mlig006243g1, partial [Macrostomum lignano]
KLSSSNAPSSSTCLLSWGAAFSPEQLKFNNSLSSRVITESPMSDTQPKALISRAMLVAVTVLLLLGAAKDASVTADELTGWCDWLPWTCETHRTPDDWSDMHETVECRMRRKRFCCNTEPPASATSCPGPDKDSWRREEGGEQWIKNMARAVYYRGMSCPANRSTHWRTFSTSLKVNACATAYPVPEPYYDTVWCPWEYWSTWSYGSFSPHRQYKRIRTRDRRCACPYTHWTAGSDDTCLGSKAYSEKQEQSLNCTGANCGTPRIIIDDYPPKPFAIVLGCLSVFIVLAVSAIIAIICAIRCKKKRLAAAATTAAAASAPAATQTSFASRLTSSFRRCGVGIFGVLSEPSAPAYGSAAFYNSEALPVPTVSLKVSGEELQQPPPPYTSQPELPRAAAAAEGPSGSSTATSSQPPPPYSPPVYL